MAKIIKFTEYVDRVGWVKQIPLQGWDGIQEISCRAAAYHGEKPTATQLSSIQHFLQNEDSIILEMRNELSTYCRKIGKIGFGGITPKEMLFFPNGNFALMCETWFSELGIAVLHTSEGYQVGPQHIVMNA